MNIYDELSKIGWYPERKINFIENNNFPIQIKEFINNFGGLSYTNNGVNYIFSDQVYIIYLNNELCYNIGNITNGILGNLSLVVNNNMEFFIYEYQQKIAYNIMEFFEKIFAENFTINVKINSQTYCILKNSGWFENRAVDISNMVKALKEYEFIFFQRHMISLKHSMEFMEELMVLKNGDGKY